MYAVKHRFADCEPGDVIRWNGRERTIDAKTDTHLTIDGQDVHKRLINRWFKSEDHPFELVE